MKVVQYQRPGLVWPTFGRLSSLQDELDRLFESPLTGWAPAFDVQENKDSFSVQVELPGLKREDIDVSLHDGAVIISGECKAETHEKFVKSVKALGLNSKTNGESLKTRASSSTKKPGF